MMDRVIEYTYGEARYEVLKELDTRGYVGSLLLKHHTDLINIINVMCRTLETAMSPDFEDVKSLGNMPLNVKEMLLSILSKYPSYILIHSEYDWTPFTSAFVLLVTNYLNLMEQFCEECSALKDDWYHKEVATIKLLREYIDAILNLMELGVSYKNLIQASNEIAAELKTWRQNRPAAMRLSQTYLQSLGIDVKGE